MYMYISITSKSATGIVIKSPDGDECSVARRVPFYLSLFIHTHIYLSISLYYVYTYIYRININLLSHSTLLTICLTLQLSGSRISISPSPFPLYQRKGAFNFKCCNYLLNRTNLFTVLLSIHFIYILFISFIFHFGFGFKTAKSPRATICDVHFIL